MRLVFYTYPGILYGANLSMIDLILGLRKAGVVSMVIYSQEGAIKEKLKILGIPCKHIPFSTSVHWRSAKPLWHPRRWLSELACSIRAIRKYHINQTLMPELVSAARDFCADIAVSNSSTTSVGLDVSKHLSLPHVWHIREYGDLDWDFYPDGGMRRRRKILMDSALVICVSQAVAHHISRQCKISDKQFFVLHNSIASREELLRRHRICKVSPPPRPFIFAITGFVKRSKGQFDAVSALRRVVEQSGIARLVVAGQGATDELKVHAEFEGVGSLIDILGHVSDLSEVYQYADCGLMCSEFEGFGRVTAEFMSWGIPVIGRNSGGTTEIIEDDVNGLLYDGTVDGLASSMLRVMGDSELRQRLGHSASFDALRRFSQQTISSKFIEHVSPLLRPAE